MDNKEKEMNKMDTKEMEKVNGGYVRYEKDGSVTVVGDGFEDTRCYSKEALEEAQLKWGK